MLTCKRCQRSLPAAAFHVDRNRASGRKTCCRRCWNTGQKLIRDSVKLRRDACEVCGSTERLCLDHDHASLEIRGTLCSDCNAALGLLAENPDRIAALLRYLRSS